MISVINNLKRGFSLLELLVAIGILSVGIIFILQALSVCARSSGIAADTLNALILAEDKLQELQYQEKTNPSPQMNSSGVTGKYRWDYALEISPPANRLYKCELNILWVKALRNEKLSVSTYFKK